LAGILFELLIGLPAGIAAALRRGTRFDQVVMGLAFVGVSAPQFVVGLLLIYLLAYLVPVFPLGGYGTPMHLVLPAVAVGLAGGGWYARVTRSATIDVLRQDFVRTARAKGVFPSRVVLKHVLKNAVLPVVALVGLDIGVFMGGIVIVESVFGWPGSGQMIWPASQLVDIPVIMGGVHLTALFGLVGHLLAALVYAVLSHRTRYCHRPPRPSPERRAAQRQHGRLRSGTGRQRRHLVPERPQHAGSADRLRLAELVDHQDDLRRPYGLRARHHRAATAPGRIVRGQRGWAHLHLRAAPRRQVPQRPRDGGRRRALHLRTRVEPRDAEPRP